MAKFIFITVGIIALLLLIVLTVANFQFNQSIDEEIKDFYQNVEQSNELVQEEDLEGLPLTVQRWLRNSGIIGKRKIVSAYTKQDATLRLKEDKPWMNAKVEQYFRTNEPGFIWKVKINAAPLFHIVGRDKYLDGHGNMLIKMLSLKTIADGSGPEIDQGTLVRYLAETMWFPTATLSNYIKWEEIDSKSAKAIMTYQGVTAEGIFNFNEKGEILSFVAQRYRDFDGEYRMETWLVQVNDYKEFEGINIPTKGELIWKLKTGDFSWYRFEVKEIKYNKLKQFLPGK